MTKAEQIALRESSYVPPAIPAKRCENCRHGWFQFGSSHCHAITVRGEPKTKRVHPLGVCDLWESNK